MPLSSWKDDVFVVQPWIDMGQMLTTARTSGKRQLWKSSGWVCLWPFQWRAIKAVLFPQGQGGGCEVGHCSKIQMKKKKKKSFWDFSQRLHCCWPQPHINQDSQMLPFPIRLLKPRYRHHLKMYGLFFFKTRLGLPASQNLAKHNLYAHYWLLIP